MIPFAARMRSKRKALIAYRDWFAQVLRQRSLRNIEKRISKETYLSQVRRSLRRLEDYSSFRGHLESTFDILERTVLRRAKTHTMEALKLSTRKSRSVRIKDRTLSERANTRILSESFSNFMSILTDRQVSRKIKEATSCSVEYLVGENVELQQRLEAAESSLAHSQAQEKRLAERLQRIQALKSRAVQHGVETTLSSLKFKYFSNLRFSCLRSRIVNISVSEKETYFQSCYLQTTLIIWCLQARYSRMAQRFCDKQVSYQRNQTKWRTFEYFCLLLEGKSIRDDMTRAWIDTTEEAENHKQTSAEMFAQLVEVQTLLDDEKSARELAEQQLEHSLSIGESLQTNLLATEQQASSHREEVEQLKMVSPSCRG